MSDKGIVNKTPRLFVWRGRQEVGASLAPDTIGEGGSSVETRQFWQDWGHLYQRYKFACPFCQGAYDSTESARDFYGGYSKSSTCRRCGFWHEHQVGQGIQDYWTYDYVAALRSFDVHNSELTLGELCAHLRRRFSDVYAITPRRFERVVAEVFRANGDYWTRCTQASRDGGFDVVLMEKATGEQTIVECKRYAKGRKVGVGIVRQLLGVQLIENYRKAAIVTTSTFSSPAVDAAASAHLRLHGLTLELIDADGLLRALGNCNEKLPPLDVIDLERFGTVTGCPIRR
jgi:hypothetical protein